MNRSIVHAGAANLRYEIREIVSLARTIGAMGQTMTWENIGDPVQKGEAAPDWIRDIVKAILDEPMSWSYGDSLGAAEARAFLAAEVTGRGGVRVTPDDILFFNGVGDAVSKVYGMLRPDARVLVPVPSYSTHAAAEAAHAAADPITYELDPEDGWRPNPDEIAARCGRDRSIVAIALLSPDNPTGAAYPRELVDRIVEVARRHGLFLIADEIYTNIVFGGRPPLHMSEWIGDVPGLAMRGISKEYPWPGARCGWLEILNRDHDDAFREYVDALVAARRMEVSATCLPQWSIPRVLGDVRYAAHLRRRAAMFGRRADEAVAALDGCDAVIANRPDGAFFLSVAFKPGALGGAPTLPIADAGIRACVEHHVDGVPPDKRFVYYLMGATGIVVVPLSGFHGRRPGFRVTLLETDDDRRRWLFRTLRSSIDQYVAT